MTKRPLIICDADEVLLQFVGPFGSYLGARGYHLALESFALTGNITDKETGRVLPQAEVADLIEAYFDSHIDESQAVKGAAEALGDLNQHADIVVLTNVSDRHRKRREDRLHSLDMPYPVIANTGSKGKAVGALTRDTMTVFIDDLPPHHHAVAEHAPDTHRLHMIADRRLATMVAKAEHAHVRIDCWSEAQDYLNRLFESCSSGFG